MNKRLLLSIATVVASSALVAGATFAYFTDSGTSNDNIFAAGNVDLQLDDVNEGFANSVTASLSSSGFAPGVSKTGWISLHNNGSIDIAEIELGANQTANVDNGDASNLSNVLNLTIKTGSDNTCSTGTDHTSAITLAIGDNVAPLTLAELEASDYDALPGLTIGSTSYLCVTETMDSAAGNNYQSDSVTDNIVLTANQDVSQ